MLPRYTTLIALFLSASSTFAQTSTTCNPTEKTCPDNTGLASSTYTHDFTTSGADTDAWNTTAGNVTATSSGLEFTITKSGDAPTIESKWYIFFGRVSFILKAAPGTGIVSSAILESQDLDELDWEWLGGSDYASKVQTNYFGKGNTTSYDRAAWSAVTDTQTTSHNYTLSWTAAGTTWLIDGVAVRTLNYADALNGKNYPQTPMNIRIGIWAGGDPNNNDEGTVEWAGGETDFADGPFTMVLEKIEVVNENPGASYSYGDQTGDYTSIKIDGEEAAVSSKSGSSASASPSASASGNAKAVSGSATVSGGASATQTGMWWTASAVAKESSNPAVRLGVGAWRFVGFGVMVVCGLWV